MSLGLIARPAFFNVKDNMIAKADKPLSDKRQSFVNEYCVNDNHVGNAYKKAYPDCNGGWDRLGHRLMKNDEVRAAIQAIKDETNAECKLTAESIISRLQQLSGLTALKEGETELPATTDAGQIRSLDLLGKHLKLWDRAGEADVHDQPSPLTDEDVTRLKADARSLINQGLRASSGPITA